MGMRGEHGHFCGEVGNLMPITMEMSKLIEKYYAILLYKKEDIRVMERDVTDYVDLMRQTITKYFENVLILSNTGRTCIIAWKPYLK
jgi:hypothetical protein